MNPGVQISWTEVVRAVRRLLFELGAPLDTELVIAQAWDDLENLELANAILTGGDVGKATVTVTPDDPPSDFLLEDYGAGISFDLPLGPHRAMVTGGLVGRWRLSDTPGVYEMTPTMSFPVRRRLLGPGEDAPPGEDLRREVIAQGRAGGIRFLEDDPA